jgi:hypothetical protein
MLVGNCFPLNYKMTRWICPDKFYPRRLYSTEGGGGGGYTYLPTCGPVYFGVVLYFQNKLWKCIDASPDHWIIVG